MLRTFYEHQSAEVVDAKTIRVPIKFASPLFLENLASEYMKMYPKHVAQKLSPEEAQQPGKLDWLRPPETQGVQAAHFRSNMCATPTTSRKACRSSTA